MSVRNSVTGGEAVLSFIPSVEVSTSQQFFSWFNSIEARIETEQESAFGAYADLLTEVSVWDRTHDPFVADTILFSTAG